MDDLREKVEHRLGRPLSDRFWFDTLGRQLGWLDEVDVGAWTEEELVGQVRDLLGSASSASRMSRPKAPRQGTAYSWALSTAVAARARQDEEVIAFRERYLNGSPIPWADLPQWIRSHEGEVPTRYYTVAVEGDDRVPNQSWEVAGRAERVSTRVLQFAGPDDEWVQISVTNKGPLEVLRSLSDSLGNFFGWTQAQAVAFVISDVIPLISPIRMTSQGLNIRDGQPCPWARRIVLDIDPTATPEDVSRVYASARAQLGVRRRLSDKHSTLGAFVSEEPKDAGWADSMKKWNRTHPKWAYAQPSNFRRDALRALARLLNPGWFPGDTPLSDPVDRWT